jgi:hypothetical protein
MTMPISLTALATEINTDPRGYGYAEHVASGADSLIADLLNLVRAEITVRRADIAPVELLEAIDLRDFPATPAGINNATLAGSWLESVLQFARIPLLNADGTNNRIRQNLNRLLGDTNGSQTRLGAISRRAGSRAEELFGVDTRVTSDDVARALRPGG